MWHTSRGDRTLRGAEAALIGTAIDTMIDALLIHIDDAFEDAFAAECQSGIAVYDSLSACQRIGLLHEVAWYLLQVTDSPLPLSAMAEATVAAIFVEIRDQVAIEIDLFADRTVNEGGLSWRRLVLAAHETLLCRPQDQPGGENGLVDFDTRPFFNGTDSLGKTCAEISVWENLIDGLSGAVLWDRDFEMADSFLDEDPGISRQRRRLLGIDNDYFTQVAPDPRPEEIFQLVTKTREIVRAKPH